MRPRKAVAVTREQVLDVCRAAFERRFGRAFLDPDRVALEIWRELGGHSAKRSQRGKKRYRELRDAYLGAVKLVSETDPAIDGRFSYVLRTCLPALEPGFEAMHRALSHVPAVRRGWAEWLEDVRARFDDDTPMTPRDLAVLRILGGGALPALSTLSTPTEAIDKVTKNVSDAISYLRNGAQAKPLPP